MFQFGAVCNLGHSFLYGLSNGEVFPEKNTMGLLESRLGLFADFVSFQTLLVQGAGSSRVPISHHIGSHILHNLAAAANDGHGANAAELMHGSQTTNNGAVFDDDVTSKGGDVGHDDMIAQLAVVGDMGVGEQVIVRANNGGVALGSGAMDGDIFADGVVVANACPRAATFPF